MTWMEDLFPLADGDTTPLLIGGTDDTHFVMGYGTYLTTFGDYGTMIALYRIDDTGPVLVDEQLIWLSDISWQFGNDTGVLGVATFGYLNSSSDPLKIRLATIRSVGDTLDIGVYTLDGPTDVFSLRTEFAISQDGTRFMCIEPQPAQLRAFVWVHDIDTGALDWYQEFAIPQATGGTNLAGFVSSDRIVLRQILLSEPNTLRRLLLLNQTEIIDSLEFPYANNDFLGADIWRGCGGAAFGYFHQDNATDRAVFRRGCVVSDVLVWAGGEQPIDVDYSYAWSVWNGQAVFADPEDDRIAWYNPDTNELVYSDPAPTSLNGPPTAWMYSVAACGYNTTVCWDQFRYLTIFRCGQVVSVVRYPLRLSQRDDDLGTFQRHSRISSSGVNRNSSPTSNRIWRGGTGTYQ